MSKKTTQPKPNTPFARIRNLNPETQPAPRPLGVFSKEVTRPKGVQDLLGGVEHASARRHVQSRSPIGSPGLNGRQTGLL